MIDLLIGVWSPDVLVAGGVAGGLFGFAVISYAIRNPIFSSGLASPAQNAVLATLMAIIGGGFFYVSQIGAAYHAGDPFWWRVASRYSVWLVFSLGVGLGVYEAARRDRERRHRAARQQVERELGR